MKKAYKDKSDKSVPIVPMDGIYRFSAPTKNGNTMSFLFNSNTNLLVVDVVNKAETGGYELVRRTVDDLSLLSHL